MSRGTTGGGGVTRIGNDNLFMAYSHVAHDCIVGSHTVFANGATLAGHVVVEDFVNVGAFSPVHQFCRVGRYAYIGACTVITQDVPPFSRVVTERETKCYGVNTVGLERARIRSRAPGNHRARLSPAAPLQAQHHAGARTNSRATERFARRPGTRGIYRIGGARPPQVNSSMSMQSSAVPDASAGWGLIAGNGQFPFLVLEAARSQGIEMAVIAIREEASPELEKVAARLHWVSLGELSRTLELLHQEGVTRAVMAGQVKHNKIFSSIRPDWKLAKLLLSLPLKNTDSLIGAVARVLESEGVQLVDSTSFLKPLVPAPGVLTRRAPDAREAEDIAYGREIARQIAGLDLGQTVVIRDRACVAVEAMEGTDETIERAARIVDGASLVVVKVSKPRQDMRFDVPVVGLKTVEVMQRCRVTALGMDAGRTLLFDRARVIEAADAAGIAIEAFPLEAIGGAERPAKQGKL